MGWSIEKHNKRTEEIRQETGTNRTQASQKAYREALNEAHRDDERQG